MAAFGRGWGANSIAATASASSLTCLRRSSWRRSSAFSRSLKKSADKSERI
jgi:hypothetical protein